MSDALLRLKQECAPCWTLPLIAELEARAEGSALKWAIRVLARLVAMYRNREDAVEHAWLKRLSEMLAAPPPTEQLVCLAREAWYYDLDRDELRTAISRLYEALGALVDNNLRGYRRCIAAAVEVAASDRTGRPLPKGLECIIGCFRDFFQENGADQPDERAGR
ncbi:MAG TPA: hypothetical protein EYH32_02510 [Anaerolineae bacterium]|nr:hypothetical protein [Anaerolineae bacterium]